MKITLPSGIKITVKSLPRKKYRELMELKKTTTRLLKKVEKGDEDSALELLEMGGGEKREKIIFTVYPGLDFDAMDQRDLSYLITATEDYSRGVPEAEIKNYLKSGGAEATPTEPATVSNAG